MNRTIAINLLLLLTSSLSLSQNLTAQKNPRPEIDKTRLSVQERVVRYAYRKVTNYGLAGNLDKNKFIKRVPDEVAVKNSIRFELNNFQIGPIDQIRNVRIFDLTTPPAGEIIQLSTMHSQVNDVRKKRVDGFFSLTAQWVNGQYSSGMDRNFTLQDVINAYPAKFSQLESYAVYEVTVFLDGKAKTYRALALFPSVNRSMRNQSPEFLDNIIGFGGKLTNIFLESKEPKGFVRLKQNKAALTKDDFRLASVSDQTNQAFAANSADRSGNENPTPYLSKVDHRKNSKQPCLFLDLLYGLGCNCISAPPMFEFLISHWTLADAANDDASCLITDEPKPRGGYGDNPYAGGQYCEPRYTVRPGVSGFRRDRSYHVSGEHSGNVILSGSCFQDEKCNNVCRVEEQLPASVSESGEDSEYLFYHQGNSDFQERTAQGGKDDELKCDKSVGYAFSRCLVFGCGVTVKITTSGPVGGSVEFGGGDLWNAGITVNNQCKNGQ